MKLLDVDAFAAINGLFGSGIHCPSTTIHGRVEAYSCKWVKGDKRLARKLKERSSLSPESSAKEVHAFAFPLASWGLEEDDGLTLEATVSFESDASSTTHEALDLQSICSLISVLNMSFPAHDFSDVPAHFFTRETPASVYAAVNGRLAEVTEHLSHHGVTDFQTKMWTEIDKVLDLQNCEFFSFNPSSYESPIEGASWSQFYFLLNKRHSVNKLCFFTLSGVPTHDNDVPMEEDLPMNFAQQSSAPLPQPSLCAQSETCLFANHHFDAPVPCLDDGVYFQ